MAGALAVLVTGCAVVNAPLLAIHGIMGMHHKTRAVEVSPFYTPGGRLAWSAGGRIYIEPEPGAPPLLIPDDRIGRESLKADDPVMSADGERILFISGVQQVTSGGAHNDHVWQIYEMRPPRDTAEGLSSGTEIERLTWSHRKEWTPTLSPSGDRVAFLRRTEFRPYTTTEVPWGRADVFLGAADFSWEASLTGPRFDEYAGLDFSAQGDELWFGARNADEELGLYRLPAPADPPAEGSVLEPELVLERACLPACLADGSGVLHFGREEELGTWHLQLLREDGEIVDLGVGFQDVRALVVSPDGERAALCARVEGGQYDSFALVELELGTGEMREVARVRAVNPVLFKPFDYVTPIVW